jgi:hypothetical protein
MVKKEFRNDGQNYRLTNTCACGVFREQFGVKVSVQYWGRVMHEWSELWGEVNPTFIKDETVKKYNKIVEVLSV